MELYIVRHGQTLWNQGKRLQGSTDISLNDNGRELAIKTGQALADTTIDIIYSSPLKRAYETATLIRGDRDIEIRTDDRIKELSFGHFEGESFSELLKDDSLTFQYFFKKPHLYQAADDGETLEHLIERAGQFMSEVIEPLEKKCERVMIVAHGALNKAIMSYIKKHSVEYFWSGGLQENCNVIIVDYTDGVYNIIDETRLFY
ncbi:MAG: histidine phosphatase family protein [Clostridium sp.]|nr:histidine phosphatase family protein [Clostridium sp.]MCM1399625.1 histidine phosphatase family protein [Clostridium sp.]MCM1460485.1 histidine phosphatase family protein [Bacteroides sp.]